MHLKTQLVRSELRWDAAAAVQTTHHRSVFVSQQGELLQTIGGSHNGGGGGTKRLPVGFISAKRFCPSGVKSSAPLWILPSQSGGDEDQGGFHRTQTDSDAAQNMWTVIKPGHVREKIAIFAAEERPSDVGNKENAAANSTNSSGAVTTLSRGMKTKGRWEGSSPAKRRHRSGKEPSVQQNRGAVELEVQRQSGTGALPRSSWTRQSGGVRRDGDRLTSEEDEDQQKLSVVEMVAFLERRTCEQQPHCKPLLVLQRSSTTITLSKLTPPEVREEEPESVRVSELVAKLESECVRKVGGGVLRSSSLRRTVGRVLLAAADQSAAPHQPPSLSEGSTPPASPSTLQLQKPKSTARPSPAVATPPSANLTTPVSGEVDGSVTQTVAPPPHADQSEPLPGLLFLSLPSDEKAPPTLSEPRPSLYKSSFYQPWDQGQEQVISVTPCPAAVPLSRSASASQDFLEVRQRLQRLLAPQPYLLLLPHHLLVKIFLLLPTRSLAALKCSCSYFKFAIENYGIRPADSLWVSDPRYRDDPCKQCKRRYGPGDVSLCRWHHKPFCQALPYGPGYWMCCHSARRDSPGCNVGLHDNRWVPAFHSINVPIYRRSCNHDN